MRHTDLREGTSLQGHDTNDPLSGLAERIRSRQAVVSVVGLGYVGLPLLVAVGEAGFRVLGVDSDGGKIDQLRMGRSYVVDITDSQVARLQDAEYSAEPSLLKRADVFLICVPTPLTDHTPDLSQVRTAVEMVGRHLTPGRLVVLESTTYPGTTEELVRPILEGISSLRAGQDFALAYSPERIDPGQTEFRVDNTPRIVAGVTERCRELVAAFYSSFVGDVVTTPSPREAEMAKLLENTFRQVNIALVNELAILAHELDVDIWEALAAAATKPFGYMPFWPGPGVGGHCISIDPSYLSWLVGRQLGYRIGFVEHANMVNNRMPDYVVARISEALNDAGKPIKGSRILVVGVSYKPGVDDLRESPALAVVNRLATKGADVSFSDPYVPWIQMNGGAIPSSDLDIATVGNQDCVVLLTAHPEIDVSALVDWSKLLFDARGVTKGTDSSRVVRL